MKNPHPSFVPLLFIVIFCSQIDIIASQSRAQVLEFRCGTTPEHNTTVFVPNFIETMERISETLRTNGFGTTQVGGTGPDGNYGLGQCYGDLTLLDCVLCYAEARGHLPGCFPANGARIFLDGCFIRVENYTFYDEITGPDDKTICGNTTRKNTMFQNSARTALLDAVREAPINGGFARPKVLVSGSMNDSAYVLANCWKTLNESSCRACLDNASASAMKCLPWSEGRVLNTGCFLRYSDTDFLNAVQRSGGSKLNKGVIIAIVLSCVGITVIGTLIGLHIWKIKRLEKKRKGSIEDAVIVKALKESRLNFNYTTLQKATGNFCDANKLGQGGFGVVYKGVLADGREIAVKRLFVNNKHRAGEFYNEVILISRVQHKNLVRLLGCSIWRTESLLVYEYLPNLSLDGILFDPVRGKTLNWQKRLDIIIGTAEGLTYLHENTNVKIIHRDIKASNILLDTKLRPKIADFGLARTFQDDKSHISTIIAGTLGYMAPEYLAHGQLTEKADVYSFGVLILEIISGRQNNGINDNDSSDSLITTAWKHFLEGTAEEIFDPKLMLQDYSNSSHVKSEILRVLHVGLLCTQEVLLLRPLMSTVLQMLSKKDAELPEPTKPPFTDEGTMELNEASPSVANISYSAFHPR